MSAIISGVKLTDQELRLLRNYLFERYRRDIYNQVNKQAASSAWVHAFETARITALPLDWNPLRHTSSEDQLKLEQWRARQDTSLYSGSASFGELFGDLIAQDLKLFSQAWPCPHTEKKQGQVVLFPNNLADNSKRALTVLVDSHYDTSFEPFILLGVVTTQLTPAIPAMAAAIHSKRYAQGLSGVRAVEIDCISQIADFLLTYYPEEEVDRMMTSYGSHVFDAAN